MTVPVVPLLLVGIAAGPYGLGLLSAEALAFLDLAPPVALAALGVLMGLGVAVHRAGDGHSLAIAGLEGGATLLLVAAGAGMAALALPTMPAIAVWTLALLAGICAASSSMVPAGDDGEPGGHGSRVIELDVLLAILAGGFALASIRGGSVLATLSLSGQAWGVVLALAAAGWLLLTQAASDTERRVFTVASLFLVGGSADYLSLSSLLGGLLTGVLWQRAGGDVRESMRLDMLYLQRPLLVLLLVIAGARVEFAIVSVVLAVAYVLLRTAGKSVGAWIMSRLARGIVPRDLPAQLLSPGVFGVALALNAVRAIGPDASILLTVVVIGTIGSDLLAVGFGRGRAAA